MAKYKKHWIVRVVHPCGSQPVWVVKSSTSPSEKEVRAKFGDSIDAKDQIIILPARKLDLG